jgi:hypothetical protein
MLKKWIAYILFLPLGALAQEMQAEVQVISSNVQNTNKQVFTTMETAMREFINNNSWTQERFEQEEKLKCTFVFNIIEQVTVGSFRATLQVQYSRPVYNSDYRSPLVNILDNDVNFQYLENDRLEFIANTHTSNLTSIIAYYVYIILGMDHDSFEKNSGQPYYVSAQNIVNNAQNDPQGVGWRNYDGNTNRYWLVDNLLNPAFSGITNCYYEYHRNGLDQMHEVSQQESAKSNMAKSIVALQAVHQKRPNSYLMNSFFDAKVNEIVQIFKDGPDVNTDLMLKTLKRIDANNSSQYDQIANRQR